MRYLLLISLFLASVVTIAQPRQTQNFNNGWKFLIGDEPKAKEAGFNDAKWRTLNLPHDWSIEGEFAKENPTTTNQGALPGGIGWYRKTFTTSSAAGKKVFIEFDGVYRDSEVWINGHFLGKRPDGYISFQYDLTEHMNAPGKPNVIAVRVDNSQQPNSRWYTGCGIYRNVRLVTKSTVSIDKWGVFVTTPKVNARTASVNVNVIVRDLNKTKAKPGEDNYGITPIKIETKIVDPSGKVISTKVTQASVGEDTTKIINQSFTVAAPKLWSIAQANLYRVDIKLTTLKLNGFKIKDGVIDTYNLPLGIRYFNFDADKGFSLNGKLMKINGVCLHHDAGALGAIVNKHAIERQLRIMKEMGVNAVRTSHNPPSPEFLDACDRMGFLVMDEAFDMWAKKKNKFDYYKDFKEWHERDLKDQILRDRNHPSVFVWSIGNEIREQFDSTGITLGKELVNIVKSVDNTRPVTCALSEWNPKKNFIYQSGALDLVGLNYHQEVYADFQKHYPGQKFVGTEQMSALATRGDYDPVTDTTKLWPASSKERYAKGNADLSISSYDNVAAYWGTNHETTWKIVKKYPFLSGMFVWTGFDYLGEPVPYPWPARSSYYGIVDLAGFPKDVYYMYQSEWTNKPVLHLLPHWNWKAGDMVDVWAYYNQADETELFLNGKSLGVKKKTGDDLHVSWKVKFEPGALRIVSRKGGKTVLTKTVNTAGEAYKLELLADTKNIKAGTDDLSYITIKVLDKNGNLVPEAANRITLKINGPGKLRAMDNGFPADLEPFYNNNRKAYNGLCLGIVQPLTSGNINVTASAEGLLPASLTLKSAK